MNLKVECSLISAIWQEHKGIGSTCNFLSLAMLWLLHEDIATIRANPAPTIARYAILSFILSFIMFIVIK